MLVAVTLRVITHDIDTLLSTKFQFYWIKTVGGVTEINFEYPMYLASVVFWGPKNLVSVEIEIQRNCLYTRIPW